MYNYIRHLPILPTNEVKMKVSLNERTAQKVHELVKAFPEGTKLTHVINVALSELHSKLVPTIEENTNEQPARNDEQQTK